MAEEVSAAAELPEIGDMPFLTADETPHRARRRAAEERTAAEFVTVIAASSGDYLYLPTLAAAAATLLLSGFALVLPWPFTFTHRAVLPGPGGRLHSALRAVPMVARSPAPRAAACSARSSPIARARTVPRPWGSSRTRDRTAVLFFVSVAERYVEIIADRGVSSVVDDKVVGEHHRRLHGGRSPGPDRRRFLEGHRSLHAGSRRTPSATPGDTNELPNRLWSTLGGSSLRGHDHGRSFYSSISTRGGPSSPAS